MNLSIISLFCFFSLAPMANVHKDSDYKSLDYRETKNDSQSKYYRINNIEGFLTKLRENIQTIDQDQKTHNTKSFESLSSKIDDISTKLSNMENDIKVIKKELSLNKKGSKNDDRN